jgi:hypothetical protein
MSVAMCPRICASSPDRVAKGGYVVSRGGWISDRSVIYLALERPVVLQDTGWPEVVPSRPGLLPFEDANGAAIRIAEAEKNLDAQSAGARELADTVFSPASALAPIFERLR